MKAFVLVTTLAAAVALVAASAAPADATSKKKKKVSAVHAPSYMYKYGDRVPPSRQHPHGVYGADGELLGMDPDPNIRLMIRRDPKPWDNNS